MVLLLFHRIHVYVFKMSQQKMLRVAHLTPWVGQVDPAHGADLQFLDVDIDYVGTLISLFMLFPMRMPKSCMYRVFSNQYLGMYLRNLNLSCFLIFHIIVIRRL